MPACCGRKPSPGPSLTCSNPRSPAANPAILAPGDQMPVLAPAQPRLDVAGIDLRAPLLRLTQLFDGNDCELLHPDGDIEVLTAAGRIDGAPVVASCTDATKMGGSLGMPGTTRIVEV